MKNFEHYEDAKKLFSENFRILHNGEEVTPRFATINFKKMYIVLNLLDGTTKKMNGDEIYYGITCFSRR